MSAIIANRVRSGFYLDSVALMRLSRDIARLSGVVQSALMMATPANKAILADAGLLAAEGRDATANDLILAVAASTAAAAAAALSAAAAALDRQHGATRSSQLPRPRSLRAALRALPDASLALISVPGEYAADEARKALRSGLDVMIFSDNVPIAEEVALKREAEALGRLVMGPDCGTAIIGGVPLAFANRVPRGDIGVIGASGTGVQEVTSLLAAAGHGVSHAIGVGSRDLSREVGALSTLTAIDLFDADPATRRIVMISKPPDATVARRVEARIAASRKRFTVCFLGGGEPHLSRNATAVATLRAAAEDVVGVPLAAAIAGPPLPPARPGSILGLYGGGTLAAEAQLILLAARRQVASNAPVPGASAFAEAADGADRVIDLGADEFTRGRPHPMIDPAVRTPPLRAALADAAVAVILLDVVIGTGAHPDPAGEVAAALEAAALPRPTLVASVTGTEADPQRRSRQVATLSAAGVLVAGSNAAAAELAIALAKV
ncbi:MAG TPA: acyl-CoA synthetase FdrA [Hyphomicrobiaceae bacterium]|nr:acyl-CoA synthetase FdrA [Hyphomicrobiaceae bacterium]